MSEKSSPHGILQLTHAFLKTQILPDLNWPELDRAVDHWVNRHTEAKGMVVDTLPALVYGALGGCIETALPLNSSWLLYLVAARVFDDIQDGEGEGHPWNRRGWRLALPVGIGLMSAAAVCLSQQQTDQDTVRSLYHLFGLAGVGAAQAQRNEQIESDKSGALESYFAHIIGATAQIFAAGVQSGGHLFGASEQTLKILSDFGYNLGMHYAILDDCHDLVGSPDSSSDVANGRYRLPVLYALAQPTSSVQSQLRILLPKAEGNETAVVEVVGLLNEIGAIAWSLNLAQVYREKALTALSRQPDDSLAVLEAYV